MKHSLKILAVKLIKNGLIKARHTIFFGSSCINQPKAQMKQNKLKEEYFASNFSIFARNYIDSNIS